MRSGRQGRPDDTLKSLASSTGLGPYSKQTALFGLLPRVDPPAALRIEVRVRLLLGDYILGSASRSVR